MHKQTRITLARSLCGSRARTENVYNLGLPRNLQIFLQSKRCWLKGVRSWIFDRIFGRRLPGPSKETPFPFFIERVTPVERATKGRLGLIFTHKEDKKNTLGG